MISPIISLTDISKGFTMYDSPAQMLLQACLPKRKQQHQFWALKNINLEIKKGTTVGIVGKNGSGKSTLLQIIAGTLQPTTGDALVNGKVSALLELGSGFNPDFTGRQNVYFNGKILGLSQEEINQKFDSILEFSGIGNFIDQPVRTYSSGMLVRLAFSVAITVQPEILIVDEALSVGDEAFQRKCFGAIQALQDKGVTILFVSHSPREVINLCSEAILMDRSEIVLRSDPKTVITYYQKLIYAPHGAEDSIRQEILALKEPLTDSKIRIEEQTENGIDSENEDKVLLPIDLHFPNANNVRFNTGKESKSNGLILQVKQPAPQSTFDPNLKPKSTVYYEPLGGKISNPRIETEEGVQVNTLIRRCRYIYTYKAQFFKDLDYIRFGMVIKSLNGLELGGASTHPSHRAIRKVSAGSTYEVKFSFKCLLNQGVYFLNAGILEEGGKTSGFIHRIVDAVLFRVNADDQESCRSSFIDFCVDSDTHMLS
jgi:lipopolysaccharide transport system ATP-binding protein